MGGLPGGDRRPCHDVADLVGARQQHQLGERVDVEVDRRRPAGAPLLGEVDPQLGVGVASRSSNSRRWVAGSTTIGSTPFLSELLRKMSAKLGREDGLDAPAPERPRRVLARAAGAEVVAGEQDLAGRPCRAGRATNGGSFRDPSSSNRQSRNSASREALLVGHLEVAGRDDLVGVDVLRGERDDLARERAERARPSSVPSADGDERLDAGSVRGSVTRPAIADAAAVSGLARNVRPPLPWRPSKLRFEVLIAYWPGRQLVAVHRDAHRAARLAPLGAGRPEDLVEALALGLGLHLLRARARSSAARRRPRGGP